jgi:hypothetical protein
MVSEQLSLGLNRVKLQFFITGSEMIYVGAVARNIENSIPYLRSFLDELIHAFPTITVCIYEDGSQDGTKNLLQELSIEYPYNVHVVCETVSQDHSRVRTWDNMPCRMECIAAARNRLMEMLEQREMGERTDDLVVMLDPDLHTALPIAGLLDVLRHWPDNTDALFATGLGKRGNYYDIFACRTLEFCLDYDVLGEEMGERYHRKKSLTQSDALTMQSSNSVWSAFGGLAVYRGVAIRGRRYSAFPTRDLDEIYYSVAARDDDQGRLLREAQACAQTHRHGALQGIYLFNRKEVGGIFYFNCYGYNYPVVCEHVPFHASMLCAGYDKMRVDERLVYLADH